MNPWPAFSVRGVELEYMIVDRRDLSVRPIADHLLEDAAGRVVNELPRGRMGWSNELTLHLVEIKNRRPESGLAALADGFQAEVREINRRLAPHGACLLGTGMHPWMDPRLECVLWPHGHADIYRAYDRVFDCRRHGFANIQSVHLNLPFADDAEFSRLHAAIRLVLPILPALAASSPITDGAPTGNLDGRLAVYLTHQAEVPASHGEVIPDTATSQAGYRREVLGPMYAAILARDPGDVLRHEWLNARGAIPRFERMAIEIRLLDMQEYPRADLAVASAVEAVVARLYRAGEAGDLAAQQAYPTARLAGLLRACLREAESTRLDDPAYLELLGLPGQACDAGEAWRRLIDAWWRDEPEQRTAWREPLETILAHGTLATRILGALGPDCRRERLREVYADLCDGLEAGRPFRSTAS